MRVVFITHNDLGLACLEELDDLEADIVAVYTRPERDDIADQTDLTKFTAENGIPLHRVNSVNTDAIKSQIAEYDPELLFVVGWSQLVDSEIFEISSIASLGMHPAPLPKGRGRAPLAWSLIKGLDETALSFFYLTEEADAGDLVGQEPLPIDLEDDASTLYQKMIEAGRTLIRKHYPEFAAGTNSRIPQDDEQATWWPKREPHHGLIDWNLSPVEVYNWIRGQSRPYPGAFSYLDSEKITIWAANPPKSTSSLARPGEIVYQDGDALGVAVWEGTLEITEVEVAAEGPISASALLSEYEFEIGDVFTNARDRLH